MEAVDHIAGMELSHCLWNLQWGFIQYVSKLHAHTSQTETMSVALNTGKTGIYLKY